MKARLELLTPDHARPLERFERANRVFFAARVGDRGDDFFEHFDDYLGARARENREGRSLFFVIVDVDGEVLGRVNISDIDQPELTELGFRVAEHAQGRGLATHAVTTALDIAAMRGVKTMKARVSTANLASRRVLEHCGFGQTGQAKAPNGHPRPSSATARSSAAHPPRRALTLPDFRLNASEQDPVGCSAGAPTPPPGRSARTARISSPAP